MKEQKKILFQFIAWLTCLLLLGYLGLTIFPINGLVGSNSNHLNFLSGNINLIPRLANWDGTAYLTIAKHGYTNNNNPLFAYFPFYPLAIKLTSYLLFGNYLLSALLISWTACFLSLVYLYKLVCLDFPTTIAQRTIKYLLLFPFSFYLIATYTESLFLFLTISGFYFLRKSRYPQSTLLGIAAGATRVVGIALFPAFLLEVYESSRGKFKSYLKKWRTYLLLFLPFGLLTYMSYLYETKKDALYFLTAVRDYYGRDQITYPFKVLFAYIHSFMLHPSNVFSSRDGTIIALEFIVSVIFFLAIVAAWFKVRKSYALYALIAWSLPLMTGRTGSMLRYVILLFPCFIVLSLLSEKYKWIDNYYTLFSTFLLGAFFISFINGYWVA